MERVSIDPNDDEAFNTFYYTVKLFKGFKYRYMFLVGKDMVHDEKQPHGEDRLGRMTNFIVAEYQPINVGN